MLVKPQEYLYISFEQLKTNLPDLSSDVMKKAPGIEPGNAHLNSEGAVQLTSTSLLVRNQLFQEKLGIFFIFQTT